MIPNPITRMSVLVMIFITALLWSGCSTAGMTNLPEGKRTEAIAAAVAIAGDIASIALARAGDDSNIALALGAVSTGIDVVLSDGNLTPERVAAFVQTIDNRHDLTRQEKLLLGRGITRVHQLFVVFTAGNFDVTNPRAREFLTNVRDSINGALELANAIRDAEPPGPTSLEQLPPMLLRYESLFDQDVIEIPAVDS